MKFNLYCIYKICTEKDDFVGEVISYDENSVTIVTKVLNEETLSFSTFADVSLNRKAIVPQLEMINISHIVSAHRLYMEDECKKYYFSNFYGTGYTPSPIYLNREQLEYNFVTLYETEEECNEKCKEMSKGMKPDIPTEEQMAKIKELANRLPWGDKNEE